MIKSVLAVALSFTLLGCNTTRYIFPEPPPAMPEMPKEIKKPCPKVDPLKDKSIKTLGVADYDLAMTMARCRNQKNGAVNLYIEVKEKMDQYLVEYEKAKNAAEKKKKKK